MHTASPVQQMVYTGLRPGSRGPKHSRQQWVGAGTVAGEYASSWPISGSGRAASVFACVVVSDIKSAGGIGETRGWQGESRLCLSIAHAVFAGARQLLWPLWRIGVMMALLAIGKDAL